MLSTWPQAGQQTRNIIADDKKNIPIHLVFYISIGSPERQISIGCYVNVF